MAATWQWTDGRPPKAVTLTAGEHGVIDLGITWDDQAPRVDWDLADRPFDTGTVDPDDPGRLLLDIPTDVMGFFAIDAAIHGEPAWSGTLRVRIKPAARPAPEPKPAPPPVPAPVPEPTPAPQPQSAPPPAPEPVPAPGPQPAPEPQPAPTQPRRGDPATATPLPAGRRYRVVVLRSGVRVPTLTRPVLEDRTLRIGRFSASRGVIPDLDLTHEFGPAGDASRCSREQAEVFWSGGHILLLSRGATPLELLEDGQAPQPLTGPVAWQPGERYGVPGGLVLTLEEEA